MRRVAMSREPSPGLVGLDATLRCVRTALSRSGRQREASRWLQVNIALFLQRPGLPPYTPWSSLNTAVEEWRAAGRFDGCFFVRKEPGLRLRFWGDNLPEKLEPELLVWLRSAEQHDMIRSFRLTVYEPEQHLFGMALAHRQFDHDARLALKYESLPEAERTRVPAHLLSLAVLNDLFNRAVDDQGEVWDVWQRLREARDVLPLPEPATDSQLVGAQSIAEQASSFMDVLPHSIRSLLIESRVVNEDIATSLRAVSSGGRLRIGLRSWLMAVSIFGWNRLGLDPDQQILLIGWMLQLYNPHARRG
jgi:thiopeptide-type bacteriocin biosynthesis protein